MIGWKTKKAYTITFFNELNVSDWKAEQIERFMLGLVLKGYAVSMERSVGEDQKTTVLLKWGF